MLEVKCHTYDLIATSVFMVAHQWVVFNAILEIDDTLRKGETLNEARLDRGLGHVDVGHC